MEIIIIGLIVFFFHESIFDFIEWILDVFCNLLDFFASVKEGLQKAGEWILDIYDRLTNKNAKDKEKVYFEPITDEKTKTTEIKKAIPEVKTPIKEIVTEVKVPVTPLKEKIKEPVKDIQQTKIKKEKRITCHLTITNRDYFLTKRSKGIGNILRLTNIFSHYKLTKAVAITPVGGSISLLNENTAYEFVTTEENDFNIILEGKDCFVAMLNFVNTLYNGNCIDASQYNNVMKRFEYRAVSYQYHDNQQFIFMDESDYTSYTLNEEQILMVTTALKENELYDLLFVDGKPETLECQNAKNHQTRKQGLSYQLTIKNINRLMSNSIRGEHADLLPTILSKYKLNYAYVKPQTGDAYSLGNEMQIYGFSIHGNGEYTLHIEGKDQSLAMKEVLDLFYRLDMIDCDEYDRIMKHFMIKTVTYYPSLSHQKYMFGDEDHYYPLNADQIYLDANKLNENEVYDLLFVHGKPSMLNEHDKDEHENIMSIEETNIYRNIRSKEAYEELEETLGPVSFKDVTLFNKHIDAITRHIRQLHEYQVELFHNEKLYDMKSADSLKEADIQKPGIYFISVRGKQNTFNVLTFVCELLYKTDIATYAAFRFERKRIKGTLLNTDCLTYTRLSEAKYIVYKEQPYEIKGLRYTAYIENDAPEGAVIVNARKLNKTSFESLVLPLGLNDVMVITNLSEEEMLEKYPCIDDEISKEVKEYPTHVKMIIDDSCFGCYGCIGVCPEDAIGIDSFAYIDQQKCTRCGKCINECPISAISFNDNYKES